MWYNSEIQTPVPFGIFCLWPRPLVVVQFRTVPFTYLFNFLKFPGTWAPHFFQNCPLSQWKLRSKKINLTKVFLPSLRVLLSLLLLSVYRVYEKMFKRKWNELLSKDSSKRSQSSSKCYNFFPLRSKEFCTILRDKIVKPKWFLVPFFFSIIWSPLLFFYYLRWR